MQLNFSKFGKFLSKTRDKHPRRFYKKLTSKRRRKFQF